MAFTIIEQMEKPGPAMFYEAEFRQLLEMHMNQLRTIYAVTEELDPKDLYRFEGDFSGYLLSKGETLETHWLIMRVNGMTHPNQFGRELRDPYARKRPTYILKPHPSAISELQQYYLNVRSKT